MDLISNFTQLVKDVWLNGIGEIGFNQIGLARIIFF